MLLAVTCSSGDFRTMRTVPAFSTFRSGQCFSDSLLTISSSIMLVTIRNADKVTGYKIGSIFKIDVQICEHVLKSKWYLGIMVTSAA